MDQLPLDIVFNILSWLPVKTLFRLRSVSRLWCTIIDSQSFATTHLTRRTEEPKALLLSGPSHDIKFKPDGDQLLRARLNCRIHTLQGSCNGLLCFTKHCDDGVVVLFNPARREVLSPPRLAASPAAGRRKYGLGFDSKRDMYKIVCVFVQESSCNFRAWVCSLGTRSSLSWREIGRGPPCPVLGRAVSAYGAVHWIADDDHDDSLRGKIVSFDIGKEEFSLTCCPKPEEFGFCSHLVDLRGLLGIVDCSSDNWNTEVIGFWDRGEILLRYLQSFFFLQPRG